MRPQTDRPAPFYGDERAMGQLAVLGVLVGAAFVLAGTLAIAMLAGV